MSEGGCLHERDHYMFGQTQRRPSNRRDEVESGANRSTCSMALIHAKAMDQGLYLLAQNYNNNNM